MIRTHEAGTLRAEHAGERVVLAGWVARRRDHGGVVFIDLRDASGVVQVVWRGDDEGEHSLRAEFCIRVTGDVRLRPAGNENPELPTGAIEVAVEELEVLSEADPLPFPVEGSTEVSEDIRIKYRYLDIRREETARALRVRSTAAYLLSDVMRDHGFVNVETPYLTRSTPEGARDFLVPVRLRPGNWYALPQSPQLFKQLLMVGGLERYYQLAAASATRTSARTGSRNSPRSTWRCPSSPARTSSTSARRSSPPSGGRSPATRYRCRCPA
jgi:aspartyl-tRNA synthetase